VIRAPSPARYAAWTLVALLLVLSVLSRPPRRARSPHPALLGPFLELAAEVQWIRFQRARLRGEEVRALELAESALALDSRSNAGWETLAAHLALDLGSPEREPALERRRLLLQAALEVLRRGSLEAADPAALELQGGLLLVTKAETDPELRPGGAHALFGEAAAAFERAASSGLEAARDLALYARGRERE